MTTDDTSNSERLLRQIDGSRGCLRWRGTRIFVYQTSIWLGRARSNIGARRMHHT